MPQRRHCPPEKRRGDRNPECHEEQQKDYSLEIAVSQYPHICIKFYNFAVLNAMKKAVEFTSEEGSKGGK
jgi:hypothetical protein